MDSDYSVGRHCVIGAGFTDYRGRSKEYDKWHVKPGSWYERLFLTL